MSLATMEPREFSLGRYRLQPGRRLLCDGAPVPLGAKPLSILAILIDAGGEIVTKDALMEKVWPGRIVEENSLQVHISAIRKALDKDSYWIKTASGRGYSFLGPVEIVDPSTPAELTASKIQPDRVEGTSVKSKPLNTIGAPDDAASKSIQAVVKPGRKPVRIGLRAAAMLAALGGVGLAACLWFFCARPDDPQRIDRYAVLPFTNRTGDPANDVLADQLTDETATRLLNKGWHISVVDAKSATAEIGVDADEATLGRKLDLDYIVKGSLQGANGRFEATAALIDAKNGLLLASSHAEQALEDHTTLARWLAASVAIQVLTASDANRQRRLATAPPIEDSVPDLLDRARFTLERKPPPYWFDAIPLVDRALSAAPQNAQALFMSGALRADLVEYSAYRDEAERRNFMIIAEQCLVEAERLAPDRPAIHVKLGMLLDHQGRHDAARAEYERALDIDGAAIGGHLQIAIEELYAGRAEEALAQLDKLLPPGAPDDYFIYYTRALVLVHLKRDQEALEAIRRAISVKPEDPRGVLYLTAILQLTGHHDELPEAVALLRKLSPRLTIARLRELDENTSAAYQIRQKRLYDALREAGVPAGNEEVSYIDQMRASR